MVNTALPSTLLTAGRQDRYVCEITTGSGTTSVEGSIETDSLVATLWVNSVTSGVLSVSIYTLTAEGKETLLLSFPQISAGSTAVLLSKAGISLQRFRIEAVYTGVCNYEVYVRATDYSNVRLRDFANELGQNLDDSYTFTNTDALNHISFRIVPPTGGEVSFEGSYDGINYVPIHLRGIESNIFINSTSSTQNILGSISGLRLVRFRTSSAGSAPGSIIGRATDSQSTLEGIEHISENNTGITQVDFLSPTITYIGRAEEGTATSDPAWQIRRIERTATSIEILYAAGGAFTQVWDDRISIFGDTDPDLPTEIDLSDDYQSDPIEAGIYRAGGCVMLRWEDIDAFNARAILQISEDGVNWNDMGGSIGGIILTDTPDVQVWEITHITCRYIRLDYTHNSVSTGTGYLSYSFREDITAYV